MNNNLLVQSGATTGSNSISYMTLDLSSVSPNVQVAKLMIDGSAPSTVRVGVYGTNNAAWTTSDLSWDSRPTLNGSAIADQNVSTAGTYIWDITSYVQQAVNNHETSITLALKADTQTASPASFHSVRVSAPLQPHMNANSYG